MERERNASVELTLQANQVLQLVVQHAEMQCFQSTTDWQNERKLWHFRYPELITSSMNAKPACKFNSIIITISCLPSSKGWRPEAMQLVELL